MTSLFLLFTPDITSVQYCGGCSVHWRLFSTSGHNISTVGDSFSTVGDSFSTVGDSFSTVKVVHYSGGTASVLWGDSFSTVEVVQYSGGITAVHVGDNISTVGLSCFAIVCWTVVRGSRFCACILTF